MSRQRLPIAEINVVPYIDVMLVLLIIFMIATPLLTQGVDVELPKADAEPIVSEHNEPIIVTVNEEGEYFLNLATEAQQAMSPQALLNRVAAEVQLAQREGVTRPVLVKGDSRVNYGAVVGAMVLLQQAGVAQVGLLTEPAANERALLPAVPADRG
jgi:biopolymer transport protein TolR